MVAYSDTKGQRKDSLNPPTSTIKTTTNDGRVWQLEVVKRKYLASILSTKALGWEGCRKNKQTKPIVGTAA